MDLGVPEEAARVERQSQRWLTFATGTDAAEASHRHRRLTQMESDIGPESPPLRILRRIDTELNRLIDDVHDLKVRITSVEEGLAGINRRLDRLEMRVERIERRLDLAGAEG